MSKKGTSRRRKQVEEADMTLSDLRRHIGLTQAQLAESMGVRQPTLAAMELQDDIRVSTLHRIVEHMGGRLEIKAYLPDLEATIIQF